MGLSFIHASDLHLDSPFQGAVGRNADAEASLREATFLAWTNLVDLCLERRPDFLLLAGDIFDAADRSIRAQLRFRDGLARLAEAGVPTYVVHGNHDPVSEWSRAICWPDAVHVFDAERVQTRVHEQKGRPVAAISGISYASAAESRNLAADFHAEHPDLFQIALLHCNCGGQAAHDPYAPCTREQLAAAGFDYWALGHAHEPILLSHQPMIVYPGCTQGRSVCELGARGCFLIEVDDQGRLSPSFHPLDAVRWFHESVDASDLQTLDALDEALADHIDLIRTAAQGRPAIGRLALTGRTELAADLLRPDRAADLERRVRDCAQAASPPVWVDKLHIACRTPLDLENRRRAGDLLGQLLSIAEEVRRDDDPSRQLRPALDELFAHRRAGPALDPPDPAELLDLLEQAEHLCADLLEPES